MILTVYVLYPAVILRNVQSKDIHSIVAIGTSRSLSVRSSDLQGFSGRKFQSMTITVNQRNEPRWANNFRQTCYKAARVETDAMIKNLTSLDSKRSARLVDKKYISRVGFWAPLEKPDPFSPSRLLPHGYRQRFFPLNCSVLVSFHCSIC